MEGSSTGRGAMLPSQTSSGRLTFGYACKSLPLAVNKDGSFSKTDQNKASRLCQYEVDDISGYQTGIDKDNKDKYEGMSLEKRLLELNLYKLSALWKSEQRDYLSEDAGTMIVQEHQRRFISSFLLNKSKQKNISLVLKLYDGLEETKRKEIVELTTAVEKIKEVYNRWKSEEYISSFMGYDSNKLRDELCEIYKSLELIEVLQVFFNKYNYGSDADKAVQDLKNKIEGINRIEKSTISNDLRYVQAFVFSGLGDVLIVSPFLGHATSAENYIRSRMGEDFLMTAYDATKAEKDYNTETVVLYHTFLQVAALRKCRTGTVFVNNDVLTKRCNKHMIRAHDEILRNWNKKYLNTQLANLINEINKSIRDINIGELKLTTYVSNNWVVNEQNTIDDAIAHMCAWLIRTPDDIGQEVIKYNKQCIESINRFSDENKMVQNWHRRTLRWLLLLGGIGLVGVAYFRQGIILKNVGYVCALFLLVAGGLLWQKQHNAWKIAPTLEQLKEKISRLKSVCTRSARQQRKENLADYISKNMLYTIPNECLFQKLFNTL